MELAQKQCVPCRGGIPPLKGDALQALLDQLEKSWEMIDEHHLQKDYAFDSYRESVRFTNLIADLAESEGHHPELLLSFRNVRVSIWTHKIDGCAKLCGKIAPRSYYAYYGRLGEGCPLQYRKASTQGHTEAGKRLAQHSSHTE